MSNKNGFTLFLIVWLGDFISTIGSGLTAFCLGVYAFKLTGLATSTAMIVLCTFLPAFLLRPIGGVLADRVDRPFLMIIGNFGSAFGIGLTFLMLSKSANNLMLIYPGIIISSIFFALQNPAYKASVSDFLTPELYAKASGLVQLSSAAQFLVAPLLGGILMSFMNIKFVLIIDILTFVFSALAVIAVRVTLEAKPNHVKKAGSDIWKEIKEGFQAIFANRGILILVSLVSLLLFYIGLIQTLLTPLVLSFADARSLGMAQSTCAIGMLITSILISSVKRKRKNTFILSVSLALMGLFFSFIGIFETIWAIIIPGFLFFSVIPFANSSIDVLIRQNIGNEEQGRVWSLISVLTYLGSMIAYSIGGFLADKIFNPLFMPSGALSTSLGYIFGVGQGRGIAFIFFLSGVFVFLIAVLVYRSKLIWQLDNVELETTSPNLVTNVS